MRESAKGGLVGDASVAAGRGANGSGSPSPPPALREAVAVPDIPGPRRPLCWKQDPVTLTRCDRAQHHAGLHTWEWAAITTALAEAEAAKEHL